MLQRLTMRLFASFTMVAACAATKIDTRSLFAELTYPTSFAACTFGLVAWSARRSLGSRVGRAAQGSASTSSLGSESVS